MKSYLILAKNLLVLLILINCQSKKEDTTNETDERVVIAPTYQDILDSAKLNGAVLIYDSQQETFYTNDSVWMKTGFLPASTFKIANSINALENGIAKDTNTMFFWDGKPKFLKSWEEDMNFFQAYQRSCVPCYQHIARQTGVNKMRETLDKIDYPGMVFDSTSIDNFWLEGASRISQIEQIAFLKRLFNKKLPLKENTYAVMEQIMLLKETPNYKLYGKTGWAQPDDVTNIGWFVGYAKTADNVFFIATNVQPGQGFDMQDFGKVRMGVSLDALQPHIEKTL